MADQPHTFNRRGAERIVKAVRRVELAQPGQRSNSAPTANTEEGFWALITGSTQDGSNKRWIYDIALARKTAAGYAGWSATEAPNDWTGTAYNANEHINGATGTFGNGVASTNLVGSFAVKPCPANTPVFVRVVRFNVSDTDTVEYWFSYANGIDGSCT